MQWTIYDIDCIKNAKKIMDADISRHLTIDYVAAKAGIGKTKLKKLFKEYYGSGLFTYLTKQRMIKAVDLLTNTNRPIKEIAKAMGYKYPSNFITAFIRYYGVSPSTYRNNLV